MWPQAPDFSCSAFRQRCSSIAIPRSSRTGDGFRRYGCATRLYGEAGTIPRLHPCLHAGAWPASGRGRYAAVLPGSSPAVHQMVVALEKAGLISRQPGVPRSIRMLVEHSVLPPYSPATSNRSKPRCGTSSAAPQWSESTALRPSSRGSSSPEREGPEAISTGHFPNHLFHLQGAEDGCPSLRRDADFG